MPEAAQAAAEPMSTGVMIAGIAGIILTSAGMIATMVAWFWYLLAGFRAEASWGAAMIFVSLFGFLPFYVVAAIFTSQHPRRTRKPCIIGLAGLAALAIGGTLLFTTYPKLKWNRTGTAEQARAVAPSGICG